MEQARVMQLPTELLRMREAKHLVDEWLEIQKIKDKSERVSALFKWRTRMHDYSDIFISPS